MYCSAHCQCIHVSSIVHCSTVQELTQLQDKHATRPDVFDDVEEEQEIEILTQEITQVQPVTALDGRVAKVFA